MSQAKKKKVTIVLVDHVYSQSHGISWRSTSSLVHESWISICSLSHWGGTSRVTFLPWCQCSNGWLAVTASILLLHKTPELVSSTTGSCEDHSRTLVGRCSAVCSAASASSCRKGSSHSSLTVSVADDLAAGLCLCWIGYIDWCSVLQMWAFLLNAVCLVLPWAEQPGVSRSGYK